MALPVHDKVCLVFQSVCSRTHELSFKEIYVMERSDAGGPVMLPTIDDKGTVGRMSYGEKWQDILQLAGSHFFQAATRKLPAQYVEGMKAYEDMDPNTRDKHQVVLVRSERERAMKALSDVRGNAPVAAVA